MHIWIAELRSGQSVWLVSITKIEKHNCKFCGSVTDERFWSTSIYRVETILFLGEIRCADDWLDSVNAPSEVLQEFLRFLQDFLFWAILGRGNRQLPSSQYDTALLLIKN